MQYTKAEYEKESCNYWKYKTGTNITTWMNAYHDQTKVKIYYNKSRNSIILKPTLNTLIAQSKFQETHHATRLSTKVIY